MYDHVPRRVRFADLCHGLTEGRPALELLPGEVADCLRDAPHPLVLVDFAGRDSVAATMACLEHHEVGTLIPVGDVVPARYGDWTVYQDNWLRMRDQVKRRHPTVLVAPWFVLEDVDLWRFLCSRYQSEAIAAFGGFTPCLGCHLHFYAMRAVLVGAIGAEVLVSGEKELHGSKRKANQTVEAVEAYAAFSTAHGVDHRFPIHGVRTEAEMTRLLGHGWREGERQLPCVLSGNDQTLAGTLALRPDQIRAFMDEFAAPLATRLVELRLEGVTGDRLREQANETARDLLEGRRR